MIYVTDCTEHEDCAAIVSDGWPDAAGSWASHFANDVAPAARLNPDDPAQAEVEDRRKGAAKGAKVKRRKPTDAELARLRGDV